MLARRQSFPTEIILGAPAVRGEAGRKASKVGPKLERVHRSQRSEIGSILLRGPVDAARRVEFQGTEVSLDASRRLRRQLVLGAAHLGPDLPRGAREPAVASVETGSEKRQGDHLRHDTPPKAP